MFCKRQLLRRVKRYVDQNFIDVLVCESRLPDGEVDKDLGSCLAILDDDFNFTIDESVSQELVEENRTLTPSCKRSEEVTLCYSLKKEPKLDLIKLSERLETTWCSDLFWIIDEKGYKDSEVYKRAGISKQTFSKLRKDIDYHPKRDTAIQLCFGLKLNLDQALDLLAKAGFTLSNSSKRDLVVKYFLENEIYDINEINYVLYEFKLEI